MSEITCTAGTFQRLFDYLRLLELDVESIAADVGLVPARIESLEPGMSLPAQHYSRLYKAAVDRMQDLKQPLPWGAGLGSEAFELMCHTLISARTLGEALEMAQRFDKLLFPLIGYNIRLLRDGDEARLSYRIDLSKGQEVFFPREWDRSTYALPVARASGLLVWHAVCGWLTGKSIEVKQLNIAAPFVNEDYNQRLFRVFRCPIIWDAPDNTFSFAAVDLDRRLVHTADSLKSFLANSVYQLIVLEQEQASTSAAIRSLVGIDLINGMPSITAMAETLHMSESSLRRRLRRENTSYQALKDEVRCEVAVDKLLNENAKVADLAEHLGFAEPSSFVRSFKSWTGQTPRDYRERIRALGPA
jgi:AraC-like DNA-binding protein